MNLTKYPPFSNTSVMIDRSNDIWISRHAIYLFP